MTKTNDEPTREDQGQVLPPASTAYTAPVLSTVPYDAVSPAGNSYLILGDGFRGWTPDFAAWRFRGDVRSIIQRKMRGRSRGQDWTVYVRAEVSR